MKYGMVATLIVGCALSLGIVMPAQALAPTDIAERSVNASVTITTSAGQGSGIIISEDGTILTCYHVYDGTSKAQVKTSNGATYEIEGLVAQDSSRDIAVTKIRGAEGVKFPFLTLGDSSKLKPGEDIIAVGSPIGFEHTISKGNVSAIRQVRDCPPVFREWLRVNGLSEEGELIQFTAPIAPGSSGGALINSDGEVIGICAVGIRVADNVYFAFPSSDAKACLPETETKTPVAVTSPGVGGGGDAQTSPGPLIVLGVLAILVMVAIVVLLVRRQPTASVVSPFVEPEATLSWPGGNMSLPIANAPVTIGRSPGNTFLVNSPDVSREHAVITRINGGCYIDDLGSTRGTFVNGKRYQRALLQDGDRIAVGSAELFFHERKPAVARH